MITKYRLLINKEIEKLGFSKSQLDSLQLKLNLIFDNSNYENLEKLISETCSDCNDYSKSSFYKLIDEQFKQTKKLNYINNIDPFNLGKEYTQDELTESIEKYIEQLSDNRNKFLSNIKSILNQNIINFGICTRDGQFFPLYDDSGFQSHDELVEFLLANNLVKDTMFLEIGSRVSTAGNECPIVRVQDINDTNNNISNSLKEYMISEEMVFAIFNIFNNLSVRSLVFEQFLINNIKNIGFNDFESKKNLQNNIYQFYRFLDSKQFDINFMQDLIQSQNGPNEFLRLI